MNDGSVVPQHLDQIKQYVQNLEKKYALLAMVVQDVCEVDEESSVAQAIQSLYQVADKDIPEEIQDMLNKL